MFKVCILLEPCMGEPFRFSGEEAAAQVRRLYPEIFGYVQTRALADQETSAFSGCAEVFFKDEQAALAAANTGVTAMLNDDVVVQSVLVGMERVVVRVPEFASTAKIKGVYPFGRKTGMSLKDFLNHWWRVHGPIAALTEEALAYVQIHPLRESYARVEPQYDGITEIYWKDAEAAARAVDSRQMREDQGSDAPNFVDMDSIALFLAEEEIVIET